MMSLKEQTMRRSGYLVNHIRKEKRKTRKNNIGRIRPQNSNIGGKGEPQPGVTKRRGRRVHMALRKKNKKVM